MANISDYNKKNNIIILGFIILMAFFIVGLVIYSSNCNNNVGSPCNNTVVYCNLNNYSVCNKTQPVQNITFYYLDLICNYADNSYCNIYDGQFYNYHTVIDYYNHYYNNSNIYTVYLHENPNECSLDNPNKNNNLVIIGLCIMSISAVLFCIIIVGYCIPEILKNIRRRKYVEFSDRIGIIENPPSYYSTNNK
jgi:hypothetical protein